jgi:NAD(P)-dependent dehydrogenase (short-subunit alcohol dehydrogenase family)
MAGRLEGKVAVVTGAGSGIGEAIVERFCKEGARVVAADISGRQNDTARRVGSNCRAVQADVSKGADVRSMLETARSAFGRLDILCNNAGIDGVMAKTGEYSEEDFDRVWAINGRSIFLGMRYAIPMMLATGGGSIVNTTSIASVVAFPTMIAYCAAKGAGLQMTRTTAVESVSMRFFPDRWLPESRAICPRSTSRRSRTPRRNDAWPTHPNSRTWLCSWPAMRRHSSRARR